MSAKKKNTRKHLTEDERAFIAEGLSKNMTSKNIAKELGKDPGTVSHEVTSNRVPKMPGSFKESGKPVNLCVYRKTCSESYICPPGECGRHCLSECRRCEYCNDS